MSILVLVESPAKIKKIQSFLGNDYEVMATVGHIRQLPRDELGFSIENNYEPTFEIMPDKVDVVKKIIAKAKGAEKVVLSSDGDNEGESISWHSAEILKLPTNKRYRATFNEITKKAVCNAIHHTLETNRMIDMRIVYAQFARMVLDKLIGYKVSPLLWKEYNNWKLSAGRVQSVVVKIIAEREAEIAKFNSEAVFKLEAQFILDNKYLEKSNAKFIATVCDNEIKEQSRVEAIYKHTKDNIVKWIIKSITKTNSKRNPSATFTTSTLQQEASARLGMSPDVCMKTAQKLYEAGLITYMRTDAHFIAEDAMKALKICIENKWGDTHYRRMVYKTKSASAQEGHECCRPVDIAKESVLGVEGITKQHNSLYQLIWRRTVASQMAPADFEIRTVKITGDEKSEEKDITFVGKHEKVLFEGYLACVNMHKQVKKPNANISIVNNTSDCNIQDEDENNDSDGDDVILDGTQSEYLEKIFTKLKEGTQVYVNSISAIQKYTKPPQSRYTEASLVKKLDDLGIGRPSTYATMIKKVQEEQRQYVEKKSLPAKKVKVVSLRFDYPDNIQIAENDMKIEGDKNKLFPTALGIMINEYLDKNFIEIMNYEFTAQIEALLDEIAIGNKIWYKVVDSVYIKLNPIIDELSRATSTRKLLLSATPDADTANRRLLGNHPITNLPVYALKSRKGFLICESNPEKEKSRFANFTGNFAGITLEEAINLLIFPKNLGIFRGFEIILKKAKNIYIAFNGTNYSIDSYLKVNKDRLIEPELLTLEQAQEIILYYEESNKAKLENAKKDKKLSDDVVIKIGPYGAYIKYNGEINVPLPKSLKTQWETITLEQCQQVIEKNAKRKPRGNAKTNAKLKPKIDASSKKETLNDTQSKTKTKAKPKIKKA
jgi:DNA topoisomerase I